MKKNCKIKNMWNKHQKTYQIIILDTLYKETFSKKKKIKKNNNPNKQKIIYQKLRLKLESKSKKKLTN